MKMRVLVLAVPIVVGFAACSSDSSSKAAATTVAPSTATTVPGPTTTLAAFDPEASARELLALYQKGANITLTDLQVNCIVAIVGKKLTADEVQAAVAGDTSALNVDFNAAFTSCGMKVSTT